MRQARFRFHSAGDDPGMGHRQRAISFDGTGPQEDPVVYMDVCPWDDTVVSILSPPTVFYHTDGVSTRRTSDMTCKSANSIPKDDPKRKQLFWTV